MDSVVALSENELIGFGVIGQVHNILCKVLLKRLAASGENQEFRMCFAHVLVW